MQIPQSIREFHIPEALDPVMVLGVHDHVVRLIERRVPGVRCVVRDRLVKVIVEGKAQQHMAARVMALLESLCDHAREGSVDEALAVSLADRLLGGAAEEGMPDVDRHMWDEHIPAQQASARQDGARHEVHGHHRHMRQSSASANSHELRAAAPSMNTAVSRVTHASRDTAISSVETGLTASAEPLHTSELHTPQHRDAASRHDEPRVVLPELHEVITMAQRGPVRAKTAGQQAYVSAINHATITFGIGPAGSGKTYLAVALAVKAFKNGAVRKIVLTRPAVEAGERLGFLPGSLHEKIDPYLQPLYDALSDMLGAEQLSRLMQQGLVEVCPLAYMRGRTLNDAFVILDEAQNTTPEQMKMFLTRLGFNSTMVVTGDITQIDREVGRSGLLEVERILGAIDGIRFIHLQAQDVVRHKLVGRIVSAYDRYQHDRQEQINER